MDNSAIAQRIAFIAILSTFVGCTSGKFPLLSETPFSSKSETAGISVTPKTDPLSPKTSPSVETGLASVGTAVKKSYNRLASFFQVDTKPAPAQLASKRRKLLAADDPTRLDVKPGPVSTELFTSKGRWDEKSLKYDAALANYTTALKMNPNDPVALAGIGRVKYKTKKSEEALPYFQQAVLLTPNDAALLNDIGLTLSSLNRHKEAIVPLTKALKIEPNTSLFANNLATAQYALGKREDALNTLRENNNAAVAYYNMAYLEYNNGNLAAAKGLLSRVNLFAAHTKTDPSIGKAVNRAQGLLRKLDTYDTTRQRIAKAAPGVLKATQQQLQNIPMNTKPAGTRIAQVPSTTPAPVPSPKTTVDSETTPLEKTEPPLNYRPYSLPDRFSRDVPNAAGNTSER